MEDILGIGKVIPINKLVDVVSSVVGRVSKSYFERKDVDTKAYEIKKLAEARAEEMKIISQAIIENSDNLGIEYKDRAINISSNDADVRLQQQIALPNSSLQLRTRERLNLREANRQLNIESVTSYAADELKDEQPITDEPVDEDWKVRFFNIIEDVSNEDMQALWGRILAGEIKQPKSYSLRTLELLKNLSKAEAEVFTKFAQIRVNSGDKQFIINNGRDKYLHEEFGISFMDRLLMAELDLLSSETNLEYSIPETNQTASVHVLRYGDKCVVLNRNENTPRQSVKVLVFTKIGIELSKLIEHNHHIPYLEKICEAFKHPNVEVKYGDAKPFPDGSLLLTNEVTYGN